MLFQEVKLRAPPGHRGSCSPPARTRPAPEPHRGNVLSPDRLPSGAPRANGSFSQPFPAEPVRAGTAHRGQAAGPTFARRPGSPGLAPRSYLPVMAAPGRRDTRLGTEAAGPPGSANPAPARAPWAWAGAAAPGDSGQPPRPRAYFSYKGKEIGSNEAAEPPAGPRARLLPLPCCRELLCPTW